MAKDDFNRTWIIENALTIIPRYEKGVLTLRALYYQLVAIGMTNSIQHYKRVVAAMGKARRDGSIDYDVFSDHDRQPIGSTAASVTEVADEIASAKTSIVSLMENYTKNRWENQDKFVEVWIEKKALQGVFSSVCSKYNVALCPCKGYPSLTFLSEAAQRFKHQIKNGKTPIILYFGDYDATGLDIPRSIAASFIEDFAVNIEVKPICLNKTQVIHWQLPPAPSKKTDSRTKKFEENGGIGQVELDAVEPKKLQNICKFAISKQFDQKKYKELLQEEKQEKAIYVNSIRKYVKTL